ncbi:MAG: YbaB/EbfC family nucleoid-associated protein [Candidatus Omnitrophica bacterium]|nr:YbaB/EbfC family nucleoid-associated protein [Candidatus Omnitrophota bacterium]
MLDKLKDIFEAQKKMNEIKKNLEKISVDYATSGGKVKVCMSGTQKVLSVDIDENFLKTAQKEIIQKELVAGLNAASDKVQKVAAQQLQATMGDFKLPGV